MPFYEHVFLARQDLANAQVDALAAEFTGLIEAGGGKVTKTEYWGLRTIAYKIKKNRKAHYMLLNIDAPFAALAEMERNVRLSEDIIRSQTIRVEAHEEGPSAMMRKVERTERDGPPGRGDRDGPPRRSFGGPREGGREGGAPREGGREGGGFREGGRDSRPPRSDR